MPAASQRELSRAAWVDMIPRMRLQETADLVNNALSALKGITTKEHEGEGYATVSGGRPAREALVMLLGAPIGPELTASIHRALQHPVLASAMPSTRIPSSANTDLRLLTQEVLNTLRALSSALAAAAPAPRINTILIKLPPTDALDDAADIFKKLSHAFDQPLRRMHEEPPQIVGFDTGSKWVILTAAASSLNIIKQFIDGIATLVAAWDRHKANMMALEIARADLEFRRKQEDNILEFQKVMIEGFSERLAKMPRANGEPRDGAPQSESEAASPDSTVSAWVLAHNEFMALARRGSTIQVHLFEPPTSATNAATTLVAGGTATAAQLEDGSKPPAGTPGA